MRNEVVVSRFRQLGPALAIVVASGFSAACVDSARLKQPLFTGSTENQRAIIGDPSTQPMPPALADSRPIDRAPLPPPPALASAGQSHAAPIAGPYAWTAVGGQVITVKQGEGLGDLALKYGIPEQQILSANQLSRPSQVAPGRVIVIPQRVPISPESVARAQAAPAGAMAPQPASIAAPPPAAAAARVHVVQPGDTLYSIARTYGTRVDQLAAINNLQSPSNIRIGQRLALTGSAAPAAANSSFAAARPVPSELAPTNASATVGSLPSEPGTTVAAAPKVPDAPATPAAGPRPPDQAIAAVDAAADPASANGTTFRWPVRGRIISGFGTRTGGERNDGINLAVPEGTSVKATEAGTVIYAGNELEGYGNLILIRHADGWVSAYAHNKDLKVRRGENVRRGQTIAAAGRTGSVSSPQLHFELRRGAKPVNPLDYLSGS